MLFNKQLISSQNLSCSVKYHLCLVMLILRHLVILFLLFRYFFSYFPPYTIEIKNIANIKRNSGIKVHIANLVKMCFLLQILAFIDI